METMVKRLQELIADAAHRVELETDPVLRAYWQGVRFGLETAIHEFTSGENIGNVVKKRQNDSSNTEPTEQFIPLPSDGPMSREQIALLRKVLNVEDFVRQLAQLTHTRQQESGNLPE